MNSRIVLGVIPDAIRFHRGRTFLILFVWFTVAVYILLPAIYTLSSSLHRESGAWDLSYYKDFFSLGSSPGLQALYGSLSVSVASVLLAGLIGVPLAYFLERNDFPFRRVVSALMLMPLALPPVVGVVSFDLLFSESGIFPRGLAYLLGSEAPFFYLSGKSGIVAVHGYAMFPFFYLLVSSAVRDIDASLIEASRSMGLGKWGTFWKVELPLLNPALFGAAVMVLMTSMASFSAPLLFDVGGMYLSTHIYNLKMQNLWGEAYTATAVFMTASLLMLGLLLYLKGSRKYHTVGKGAPRVRQVIQSPMKRAAASAAGFAILTLVLLPHIAIVLWSFTKDGTWTHQILPPTYSVENYSSLLGQGPGGGEILQPVKNSLWMAGLATFANVAFGIAAAYILVRSRRGVRATSNLLLMLPWALPGTVIAMNLIATFNHRTPLALGFDLSNSVFLLPIAYFIRNIPLVVRPLAAAWERWGEDMEQAARSLGSGRLRTLRTVLIPLVISSLIGGALLAFVTALGEFVASAILFTPANKPIAMAIYGEFHSGAYGLCSAYGVFLIILIVLVMVASGRGLQRSAF